MVVWRAPAHPRQLSASVSSRVYVTRLREENVLGRWARARRWAVSEFADHVSRSLGDPAAETFERRVTEQASTLIEEIDAGAFDNPTYAIGLELEVYATDTEGRLARLPPAAVEPIAPELGLHNAEINTPATAFDAEGIAEQVAALTETLQTAGAAFEAHDRRLVLDAMWTIGPPEGAEPYLTATEQRDGVTVASNMQQNPRYAALDRDIVARHDGTIDLELPGVELAMPSILAESLATSIQPHLQVPSAAAFPAHYNTAIRTMAPVLSLATNSPFLPGTLYGDVDPETLLEATHHESRIAVFERSINTGDRKVRFPRDIEQASDIVRRIEADALRAPCLREWVTDEPPTSTRDGFWELDYKRGTYWRWLRGLPGGQPVTPGSERSLRIEYRPLPTQPTARATIALQLLTVGAIRGLVAQEHPIGTLPWEPTRDSFYAVASDGRAAELAWVDRNGERTNDRERIIGELRAAADVGLGAAGLAPDRIEALMAPIDARIAGGPTPSEWKVEAVRAHLDAGLELSEAIHEMQQTYLEACAEGRPVTDWAPGGPDR